MEYNAHSENDQGQWHLLSDHLKQTAKGVCRALF